MSHAGSYSALAAEIRRHDPAISRGDPAALMHYATLAASSHNTQPWVFRLGTNEISIVPDLSRRCPAVDPDDHHLYASLGCAAENLLLAAAAAGLHGELTFDASSASITIRLEQGPVERSTAFEAIPHRQCTRSEYDGKPLAAAQLDGLEQAGRGAGVAVMLLTNPEAKEQVAEYVAAGNAAQFADPAWAKELRQWIRFSAREALATRDGLYGPVMGSPDVPRWLGESYMRVAFSANAQSSKDSRHIRSASTIAVVVSDADDERHWIEAGRAYQRLALQATASNLQTAFINQPVEVAALRGQFARYLGIRAGRPDLVLRIGHGPEMPRTLRRRVQDVMVADDTVGAAAP